LDYPEFKYFSSNHFFPEVIAALYEVNRSIIAKKYELGIVDDEAMTRYVVSTSNLGWINCDRFIRIPDSEKRNLAFSTVTDDDQFYLIFKDRQSLLTPVKSKGKVSFNGVPKGEDVRLVAVTMNGGNVSLASHDFTIDKNEGVKLTYFPSDIKGLKKALDI
jgi:hypothetical protein